MSCLRFSKHNLKRFDQCDNDVLPLQDYCCPTYSLNSILGLLRCCVAVFIVWLGIETKMEEQSLRVTVSGRVRGKQTSKGILIQVFDCFRCTLDWFCVQTRTLAVLKAETAKKLGCKVARLFAASKELTADADVVALATDTVISVS